MKKALIIGFGSAGQNHNKILNKLSVKTFIYSRRKLDDKISFPSLEGALKTVNPDYVVIANETSEHLKTLNVIKNFDVKKVLVEKPLFQNFYNNLSLNKKRIFVGYNLRFHPLLIKLKRELKGQKVLSAEVNVGSFLPDWRKNQNYKKNYSIDYSKGGGVLRDLSHEIDYLLWIFGPAIELVSLGGHYSTLFGDSDDVFKLLIKMKRGSIASIHLDYLNRIHKRKITVVTNNSSYIVDLVKNTFYSNSAKNITLNNFDISKTYYDQHHDIIFKNSQKACSFGEGIDILKFIEAAEKSNQGKIWVKV